MGLPVELNSSQIRLAKEMNQLHETCTGYRDFEDKIKKTDWYLNVAPRGW